MDILSVMKSRKSARAFLNKPVSRTDIEEIFFHAGLAPSAINLQPWEYVVTYGAEMERLIRRLNKVHAERRTSCGPGAKASLPDKFTHRSKKALEVMAPRMAEIGKPLNTFVEEGSCSFYGAPIAIIVTMDRRFPSIRYLDVGLSVSYLLLAAEAKGLATCPIGLITAYAEDIAEVLGISEEKEILLGIALGYADEASPVNRFKTDRAKQDEILCWYE